MGIECINVTVTLVNLSDVDHIMPNRSIIFSYLIIWVTAFANSNINKCLTWSNTL